VKQAIKYRRPDFTAGYPAQTTSGNHCLDRLGAGDLVPAGLAFAVWTIANLAPRARSNHKWYRETFPDYPENRKALLPGVW